MTEIVALDLFAGTGWGVACGRLGIDERAVEIMLEAVATRTANGMETTYRDVWQGLLLSKEMHDLLYGVYTLLIASPPCQTFSLAGNGAGRRALNEVLEAIQLHAYKDPQALLEFGERHDPRTALVLAPLAYIYRDRPQYVALEQVPQVLPVWQAYAAVMQGWGYSVQTAVLQAEQYGVPQTRRRAILVARLDGPVSLPTPTHSAYYPREPHRLDLGVDKWISMAEALGWGNGHPDDPAKVIYRNGNFANAARRYLHQPAPTVLFGHNSNKVEWMTPELESDPKASGIRVTTQQAAVLQTYPEDFQWRGVKTKQYLQLGNAVPPLLAQRVLEALTQDTLL